MKFETTYNVPMEQLDPEYRHLHHARCLRYLEKGRLDYLEFIGCPNATLIQKKIYLVLSELTVKYKREVFAGALKVTVDEVAIEGKDLILKQRAINEKGKDCIDALVTLRALDGALKRSVAIPEELLAKMEVLGGL